ncbi:MAG: hypothetical protein V1921_06645 [Candidatus Altiarchaeota archaeon]
MTGTKVVKLKLEGGSAGQLPRLKDDATVEKAVRVYEENKGMSLKDSDPLMFSDERAWSRYYDKISEELGDINVDSVQLQRIYDAILPNYALDESGTQRAGMFLTALIQKSKESELKLTLHHPVDALGYKLKAEKTVRIKGNIGSHTGYDMERGRFEIDGNAENKTGIFMKNGVIHITGNAGYFTGTGMENGELRIDGKTADRVSPNFRGGKIYENGKLVAHK